MKKSAEENDPRLLPPPNDGDQRKRLPWRKKAVADRLREGGRNFKLSVKDIGEKAKILDGYLRSGSFDSMPVKGGVHFSTQEGKNSDARSGEGEWKEAKEPTSKESTYRTNAVAIEPRHQRCKGNIGRSGRNST